MKQYRNVIIVGEHTNYVSASFENANDKPVFRKYNNLPLAGTNATTNINALSIINKYLLEIVQDKRKNGKSTMHYFIVPVRICKMIKDGTYKNWIKTGKTLSGKPVDEIELRYWTMFSSLYKELFEDVVFKPVTAYSSDKINKAYNHSVFIKKVLDELYKQLDKNKEDNLFDSLDDIL